ncbi:hypothetical protein LINPERHAP2_LOCUS14670 [Linum perenne]
MAWSYTLDGGSAAGGSLYLVAMSPASKSKSKDKKPSKETQKAVPKSPAPANGVSGIPASAYNPQSGTFYTLETLPTSSTSPLHSNGRFRNIDETDDHFSASLGAGVEYDSVSNNGSWSGESEDHKEKTSNPPTRLEAIPGADNDKREKIRQKNERKHQRQKERRAQELHERCRSYLMSQKLEALAQKLVGMGFLHERATMALILNEGKVEESVTWLLEGGEDADKHRDINLGGGSLKIDIADELARIAELEVKYKCTKQEVERAVVGSEGDLDKAADSLSRMKLDPPSVPLKPEETGDPPTVSNGKASVAVSQNVIRPQVKPNQPSVLQQRRDDKDFNYTKATVPLVGSSEVGIKNMQPPSNRIIHQSKLEWTKQQVNAAAAAGVAEKRWPGAASNPSVSYPLTSTLQVSPQPPKAETRYVSVGSEYNKVLHPGTSVREPVVMMQRPQTVTTKQLPATSMSSSPPGNGVSWYPTNSIDMMKSNGLVHQLPVTRNMSPSNLSSNQMFHHQHQHHHLQYQPQQHFIPGSSPLESPGASRGGGNGLWNSNSNINMNRTGTASSTLAAASNLGLFSGGLGSTGSSGASSPVDWGTASSMGQLDYNNIDWSLDRGMTSPRPNITFAGQGSLKNGAQFYDPAVSGMTMRAAVAAHQSANGVAFAGLQTDGVVANPETSGGGSQEWTSPFEGKDLFSLPRQFVSSPSL